MSEAPSPSLSAEPPEVVDPISPSRSLDPQGEMGLLEHLAELRKRLLWSLLAITIGTMVAYQYSSDIFNILNEPVHAAFKSAQLIGTGPAEAFILRIKVAIFAGIFLTSPIIFYQFWLFVAPGLYQHERRMALPFVAITTLLFILGAWFCLRIILPISYAFFEGEYQQIGVTPQLRIGEHLSMVITTVLGFGGAFELPMIAFILGRMGILSAETLIGVGRYAIVAIFVIAAVLTPPDVLSQLLMAGPLLLLYGLSILILKWTARNEAQGDATDSSDS